jgi:signal transduction histidine kinase/CheY-like chemotaxis protein
MIRKETIVKQTSLWLSAIGVLSSVWVLAFLITKSLPINTEEHQRYLQTLKQEQKESYLLSKNIIESKYAILSSYNLLSHPLSKFENNQKKLLEIPSLIRNKDRQEIQKLLKEYSQILEQQKKIVTEFETENAIIKNSLGYLPVLMNDLHNNLSFQNWDANLVMTMDETLQSLILYNMTTDRHLVPVLNSKIARLKQLQAQNASGSQDVLIKAIITHGTIIVEHKTQFNELVQQLDHLNVDEYIQELISVYSDKYENALTKVNSSRIYAFSWSLLVIITIAYLINSNLSKTNRSIIRLLENFTEELESKVEARTTELATSMYEAEKARVKAEEANKAKSRFLANMSHELRTPLNAVLGFTQIMTRDLSLSQDNQNNLNIISRSGEHLLKLINDILEMSKIEVGQITLNKNIFELDRLLDSLEDMFRLKANSKNLQLLFEKAENLPLYISTDESKLTQILINLLGNALKFTEEGGVMIRIDFRPNTSIEGLEVSTFNYLYFEVEDTGAGIAADEIDKLFIPFEQTATGRKSQEGTGLGLPISQKFIQLMGGELAVKSTVGRGTIFSFNISIDLVENSSEIYSDRKSRILGLEPDQPAYRILAVDDRPESRLLLVKLLSSLGFQVKEAENGKEAVELWENWQPDLILMDMRMPVMDGYEATRTIKSLSPDSSTRIVALTASAFEEERAAILEVGCDDFLRKPFREDLLLGAIGKHLNARYIYEDSLISNLGSTSETKTKKAGIEQLTSDSFSVMSLEWIEQFLNAAEQVDNKQLFELIDRIPPEYESTADTLTDLVKNFRCDKIIDLIEKIKL